MKKKIIAALLCAALTVSLAACGSPKQKSEGSGQQEKKSESGITKIGTVTDSGGINDQAFNQSAWEGLQRVAKAKGVEPSYLESKQQAEYPTNLDKMIDDGNGLIWGNAFTVADATLEAADINPDVLFGVLDFAFEDAPENVFGVVFRAQESSFMAGYAAAHTTQSDKVGFIGGQKSDTIDQFEWGFKAGVIYGAKELGKEISVDSQYAESFADAAKGKAIANKMYNSGCDVLFCAAGGTGMGVIDAAKEADKFVIGVDRDQSYLAPENVLTSALKDVGVAVEDLSAKAIDGEAIGGQNYEFGLAEDGVGIPKENPNMDPAVYEKTMSVKDTIVDGTIVAPKNEETYNEFVKNLK